MTPPASPVASAPGAASQTTDVPKQVQLGAFTAPAATSAAPGVPAAKPVTDHLSVDLGSGNAQKADKPVPIPQNVDWKPPVTAVQAKGPQIAGQKAVITFVGDGDSLSARTGDGKDINCRIDSIDAPEVAHPGKPGQPYGEASKKTLQDMILNKEVTVRVSKPATANHNYGRALCQIEIEGQNIDKKMLQEGMAWLYRRFNKDPELSRLELDAKSNGRGLWADKSPVNPEDFRRMLRSGN